MQKYEKGVNRITAHRLVEFCDFLGVPVEAILKVRTEDQETLTKQECSVVAAYRKLTPTNQAMVRNLMATLTNSKVEQQ